mgnify:CR=1 FL=1
MSVSELKKKGMEEEEEEMVFLPTLPVFMEKEQEEKGGATRGTAYTVCCSCCRLSGQCRDRS